MAIFDGHDTLAITFGILGNIISIFVYFAPLPTFYRIYHKKSTEGFQSLPYLVALFSAMVWFYYALLKQNAFLLLTINSFGCFIESIYIVMFIVYAPKLTRNLTLKLLMGMNVASFALILLLTKFLVKGHTRVIVVGWICVAFSVSVFAAPLSIVARVIRTKSVEFMPFTLSFFLTLSATIWFTYGLFLKDICVALPNIVGFILGLLQMLLYAIYRNTEKTLLENKRQEQIKSIVILSPLGASEIHPVEAQSYSGGSYDDEKCNDERKNNNQENEKSSAVLDMANECPV